MCSGGTTSDDRRVREDPEEQGPRRDEPLVHRIDGEVELLERDRTEQARHALIAKSDLGEILAPLDPHSRAAKRELTRAPIGELELRGAVRHDAQAAKQRRGDGGPGRARIDDRVYLLEPLAGGVPDRDADAECPHGSDWIGHALTVEAPIEAIQLRLAALWVALMLTYLLGDVLRIFAGDFKTGEIGGMKGTQATWLGIAALMLIPILMVVLSVTLPAPVNRWANLIAAAGLFVLNLAGVRGYPGWYDRFLIVVGLIFNVVTVWYAWNWETV